MLYKTREIVKTHYNFRRSDADLDSTIAKSKTHDNFCCKEDNPKVDRVVPSAARYQVLMFFLSERRTFLRVYHCQGH